MRPSITKTIEAWQFGSWDEALDWRVAGPRACHKKFPSGSCDESCVSFVDEIAMNISNFPLLEWLKLLTPAPKRLIGAAGAAMWKALGPRACVSV
jgi:hypothetical protein